MMTRNNMATMLKTIAAALMITLAAACGARADMSAEDIRAAYQASFSAEKSQDYEKAMSALDQVAAENPDSYTPNLRLGWLNYLAGKFADSEEHYAKAAAAAPDSIEAKLGATLPLLAESKYKEAAEAARAVTRTDQFNYTANLRLAFALRMQKKYEDAIKTSRKMLSLYPTDVSFMAELALSYYGKGDTDAATDAMWGVYVLDPDNATAKEYFGK